VKIHRAEEKYGCPYHERLEAIVKHGASQKEGELKKLLFYWILLNMSPWVAALAIWLLYSSQDNRRYSNGNSSALQILWETQIHFRVNSTLHYIGTWKDKYGIEVEYNFFAPHHGKSMADGHAGV